MTLAEYLAIPKGERIPLSEAEAAQLLKETRQLHIDTGRVSKCCAEPVRVSGGNEGTNWYECVRCGQPCDPKESTK